MNDIERALGFLGLISRSGNIASGEESVLAMIRSGRAGLVLIDEGAGCNTRKRFDDACAFRNVPLAALSSGELGRAIGKPTRKVASVPSGAAAEKLTAALKAGITVETVTIK